jgi:putative aldouronate transport system permease protein
MTLTLSRNKPGDYKPVKFEPNARPPWMEKPSLRWRLLKGAILGFVALAVVYPFWSIIATSLSDDEELRRAGGLVTIPRKPTLQAYEVIFKGDVVTRALKVSLGITVVGTLLSVLATIAMAYALSRPTFFGRPVFLIVLLTLFFSPGIIPMYLIVRQAGLIDSYAALILPVLVSAFNLIVVRQFFMGIPQDLIDSAKIDGAGDLAVLFRIILPLSKPVIAVVTLFYGVAYWNSFFSALLYLNDYQKWPMQLILRQYVLQGSMLNDKSIAATDTPPPELAVQMAVVVVATVPILVLYPFLQRFFTSGVLKGAIKG